MLLLLHPFNGLFSRTTWVCQYQKGKPSLDLNEARDDGVLGWLWHQLDHMRTICTSLQTDNHTNTSLNFLQAEWSSWRPTNSVKAMKANPFHCTKRIIPHVFANMDHSLVNKAKKTWRTMKKNKTAEFECLLSFIQNRKCVNDAVHLYSRQNNLFIHLLMLYSEKSVELHWKR